MEPSARPSRQTSPSQSGALVAGYFLVLFEASLRFSCWNTMRFIQISYQYVRIQILGVQKFVCSLFADLITKCPWGGPEISRWKMKINVFSRCFCWPGLPCPGLKGFIDSSNIAEAQKSGVREENGSIALKNIILTLSLPRVIKFKFPLQAHQSYYITQYEELGFS